MVRAAVRAPGCTPPHWVNRQALDGSKAYTVTSTLAAARGFGAVRRRYLNPAAMIHCQRQVAIVGLSSVIASSPNDMCLANHSSIGSGWRWNSRYPSQRHVVPGVVQD